jgi:hypothetical protein
VLVGKGEEKAEGDIVAMTETNDQGIYKFTKIEKGKYEILLDLPGASQATSYTVDVTSDSSSLSNYDYKVQGDTIYVNESSSPTLIGENEELKNLMVYPNPASDYIYISTDDAAISRITLFDMTGKVVNTVRGNNSGSSRLHVSQYEGGMYLLKVETRKGTKTMKVYFHE